mmetsp:Transcript_14037/g.26758  ORF Transcript_14037/g.26758 Transcript_14037/m.26758 type:complete len:98 (+) Transcript_14037:129-422(+)
MHCKSSLTLIFSALLVWPIAITTAIQSSSQVPKSARRQLSAADQLNILRLGFIPPSKDSDIERNNNDITGFGRGGSMDDVVSSSEKKKKGRFAIFRK